MIFVNFYETEKANLVICGADFAGIDINCNLYGFT